MNDIIIVGGGIAGISAAAHLAPLGQVTLLEAEPQLGYHASGRSAAIFLAEYGNDIVRALNHASLPLLQSQPGALTQRDMLLVGLAGQEDRFQVNATGFGLTQIPVTAARDMVPVLNMETVTQTATRPDVYDLDTDLVFQNFRKTSLGHGACIETRARVDRISRDGPHWFVHSGDRTWRGDVLVNAAGAWADQIAGLAGVVPLGIQPYRRSMARVAAPVGIDVSDWPFIDGVDDSFYMKPDAGALLISPADETPLEPQDAWADDMDLAQGIAAYEEIVTTPVARMLSNWAGLRSFAPDRALVIGRDPSEPAFFWLAGQGGYGYQTCCAAAELTAELVQGRTTTLDAATVSALDPGRFSV